MAIYSLADLRNSAPQELRSLSDDELIREYSKRKNVPFESVADYLGVKPRGFLSEMGRQLVGGLAVDVPKMVGQGQQFLARELPRLTEAFEIGAQAQAMAAPGSYDPRGELSLKPSGAVAETGRRLVEESTALAPKFEPDMRGRGLTQQTFLSGARAVAPVAATIPAAVVPGGVPFAVAGLFGTSQAQDTYEKLIAQGVPEDEARQASYRTGAIQGVGEGLATYVGGKLFKPLLGGAGGRTAAGVAAEMTDTGIIKPFAKGLATNLLVQPTTEIAQDVGTSMVEQAYGGKAEDLAEIAKQSAMGATGLTLLLGPFAFGAHVSRSNNAAALKTALSDDPLVPRDIRAQAIAAVNVEAQRQGVDPKDIGRWTQEQIELEDRRTDALRRMEEAVQNLEVGAGINQRVGISGQRVNEADYIAQFEEAFNEPSGQFTYERLPDGSDAPRELSMGEVMERQANTDPSAPKDLLRSTTPKTAKEILAEIRQAANDPMSPSVWRFPVSTGLAGSQRGMFAAGPEAFNQPRPISGELSGGQQAALGGTPPLAPGQLAAARGPIDQNAPRPATGLGAAQQLAAGGPAALTSAGLPVRKTVPSGGTSTTVPPSAPAAPEVFSTAPAAKPTKAAKPAKPKKLTLEEKLTAAERKLYDLEMQRISSKNPGAYYDPTSQESKEMDKARAEVKQAKTALSKKPAQVVAPQKTTIARSIEQALDEEMEVADTALDNTRAKKVIDDVNKEDLGAEVQGAKQIKAPGRVSLSQRSLLGIRDAIFRKSGKVAKAFGRTEQKVVDAVSSFTNAYDAYLNYSANLAREVKNNTKGKADERVAKLEDLAKEVQNSLFYLGQSLDNNAKNVEAVVRVVKDTVQQKLAKPGKTKKETLAAMKSLDTALSSGWAAAKRETFMSELPDLADISGQAIRPSSEMAEKAKGKIVTALEDVAKNGYINPQNRGEKYYGLPAVLQYLRFNTTPMGRILARALRDALSESANPVKVSFVDKSGSRYDPKTNTVYINKSEQSAEVVLHEAFHAALQWYVYQNPNAPAIKQLELSLKRALDAKGLTGKALEVQNILQDLVNKKRGMDAVLELVSYTATLNEFRRAMQEIKTGDAPKSFLDSIRSVWAMYKAIVRRLLGSNDTVASDVLSASMQLLEESTKAQMPKSLTGKALDIATTAFKRWFGDSKVVDSDGQPLVVYHGTSADISAFWDKFSGSNTLNFGMYGKAPGYFSKNPREASGYAVGNPNRTVFQDKSRGINQTNRPNFIETPTGKIKEGANVMPVYISIKNPLEVTSHTALDKFIRDVSRTGKFGASSVTNILKALGYDGIIVDGGAEIVPFSSTQIKSQFNEGTFDSNNPNILQAAVQSNKATQTAAGISAQDYRGYTKRIAPAAISTKAFFDVVGWNENVAKKFEQTTGKMAEAIRKDFPSLERFLIYINSRFSAGAMTSQEIENYKVNKSVGYQQMERLANFVTNRSAAEIRALFDYMDGNKKALDGLADKGIMTRTADNVMEWFKTYVADLPAAERSFFETRKFSESLLYAAKSAQVASSTFGARKLSKVLGLKHRSENTLEGFMDWLAKDSNGDVDLNSRFYEVFKNDGLRPGDGPEHAGYMSISEFEKRGRKAPDGFQVDATREWWMSQYDPDRGYKFSSSMTAKQAIQENKVDELANAMRNTMAALANNYASRQFSKAIAADKSIAFDSLEDIKAFSGQVIDEDQVLKVSQEEAKSPQITSLYRRSGTWVKLPDSAAYGDLANKYLPGPVWSAMIDMADRRPLVEFGLYNDTMRWFKKSKTVYNPGTHVTNVASNITLAMMHDIPMMTLGNAARIFALYEANPKALSATELDMMSSFMNSGAMLGDFSSAEVKKALYDAWKDNMAAANDNSLMKRLAAFTNYEKSKAQKVVQFATKVGKKADFYATEVYAAEDNIFRLAAFLTKAGDLQARDKTTTATPEQLRSAGDFARKAFLDYDIDSKAVRVLRQSVIPFISWGYAVAPVLGRIALHQPWKIANILMAYYLLDVAMAAMGDGDDEELRETGPEYMRERMFFGSFGPHMYIRIPFMGDAENPVYYKLGDYVPFASMTKGLPNGLFGQSWIPSMVTPSGPFVSAVAGLLLGVDPYTGKDIHNPTDSEWDKLVNSGKFAYDTAMPSAMSSKNWGKVKDIIQEKEGITGVKPSNLVIARMLGLKIYDYNIDESAAIQDKIVKGIERDFKSAMTKAKREEYRKGYPDYEALDKELDTLQERMEKRIAEVRGGEEE